MEAYAYCNYHDRLNPVNELSCLCTHVTIDRMISSIPNPKGGFRPGLWSRPPYTSHPVPARELDRVPTPCFPSAAGESSVLGLP